LTRVIRMPLALAHALLLKKAAVLTMSAAPITTQTAHQGHCTASCKRFQNRHDRSFHRTLQQWTLWTDQYNIVRRCKTSAGLSKSHLSCVASSKHASPNKHWLLTSRWRACTSKIWEALIPLDAELLPPPRQGDQPTFIPLKHLFTGVLSSPTSLFVSAIA